MNKQTEAKHTPTPSIEGIHGQPDLRDVVYRVPKEKVDSIVRAVNSHEELLHALRQAELQLDRDWGIGKSPISKMVRSAIAKAEAQS